MDTTFSEQEKKQMLNEGMEQADIDLAEKTISEIRIKAYTRLMRANNIVKNVEKEDETIEHVLPHI